MATLVFDIETIGEAWEELDEVTQATLTRWVERTATREAERIAGLRDIREGLGFSPLTGRIVAIGVFDVERNEGAVYFESDQVVPDETVDGFRLKVRNERQMLEDFFAGARSYDTFVSFNGRAFDVPFLLHRAAINHVPALPELMDNRYLLEQRGVRHVDLQDQLTFYGAMSRRPSLHLFCRAYGIESPKAGGVSGDDVSKLFLQKRFRDIAQYNAADVRATAALYERWREHFAPESFLNRTIDF